MSVDEQRAQVSAWVSERLENAANKVGGTPLPRNGGEALHIDSDDSVEYTVDAPGGAAILTVVDGVETKNGQMG